jgi:hypothetical protein
MIIDSGIVTGSLISQGSMVVTGSVTSTLGFTGSLLGTAATASYWSGSITNAATASYVVTAQTASYVLNTVSSSYALTASYVSGSSSTSATASYVNPLKQAVIISGSLEVSGSSGNTLISSNADTLILSGSATITGSLVVTGSLNTTGTITAQTLVIQTISSSVEYSSGSNVFGSLSTNTQTFTGSVGITGSLAVNGTVTSNAPLTINNNSAGTGITFGGQNWQLGSAGANGATISYNGNVGYNFNAGAVATPFNLNINNTTIMRLTGSSNSVMIQGGGTFIDNGYRLQIQPTISGSLFVSGSSVFSGSILTTGSITLTGNQTISGSLYINSPNQTMGQFVGSQNGYVEFSVRNTNTGISASGDIAVYADNGTTLNNYIDMGINNSGLSNSYFYGGTDFGDALDAYVYNVGGNLRIGNATSTAPYSQSFYLFSNPTATPNITISGSQVAISKTGSLNGTFDVLGDTIITGSLKVSAGITGSHFGTSSYATQALSASYAPSAGASFPYTGSAGITGSLSVIGNVGFGTLTPTGSNMSNLLHLNGANAVLRVGPYYSTGGDRDFVEIKADSTDTKVTSPNERFWIENTSGNIIINASSNVGIGTTTPNTKLDVNGNTTVTGSLTTTSTITSNGGTVTLNNGTSNIITFGTNGVAAPTFTTRSSGTKLVLYDALTSSQVDFALGIEGSTMWFSTYNASSGFFKWYGGTTQAATLSGTGTFTCISLTETSSKRYKENIHTLDNSLNKILQLRGVTYNRKENQTKEIGVIAEEVEKILPEVVIYNKDNQPDSVSYGRITAVLIEAIKEQQKQIDELKALLSK